MPNYRFCAAQRTPEGLLSTPVHEEVITANDAIEAADQAKAIELSMSDLNANALYLVDASGHVVWSLRIADTSDQLI